MCHIVIPCNLCSFILTMSFYRMMNCSLWFGKILTSCLCFGHWRGIGSILLLKSEILFQNLTEEGVSKGSQWDAETSSAWPSTLGYYIEVYRLLFLKPLPYLSVSSFADLLIVKCLICHAELVSASVRSVALLAVRLWNEFSMTVYFGQLYRRTWR